MPTVRSLSRLTLASVLALVAIGGFTRGSGSGYGCADRWPLCEDGLLGGLLPRLEYHMVIEWTHRWVAALVGLLAVATAVTAWRRVRHSRWVAGPAIAAVIVIGFQAWVGRMVVTRDLDADLVSFHLGVSMVAVALLTIVVVASTPPAARRASAPWGRRSTTAALLSIAVLLLGSYVHNLFVDGWPLVGNTLLPDLSNRYLAIHFMHRVAAGLGLVYLLWLAVAARREALPERERFLISGAAVVYATNVGVGAAHVFTEVGSSGLVAAHLLAAALVWSALVAVATSTLFDPSVEEATSSSEGVPV